MKKSKKQPQHHKSSEELTAEINAQMEVNRKREMAKNKLYPLLLETSKSIEDAKLFCQATVVAIKQAFNKKLSTMRVSELELIPMLDQTGDSYEKYKRILEMFSDETLQDSVNLIEGMQYAIEGFQKEEMTKRGLDTLKTDFL